MEKLKVNIRNINNKDKVKFGEASTLTYDQVAEKINKQNNMCYVCLQPFKYDGGKWCNFFPSVDRINNYKPHTNDNIAISCVFCNTRCFKQVNIKKCGLCENHNYDDYIITKSNLFFQLRIRNLTINDYINGLYNCIK
jgi:hypothetical protein